MALKGDLILESTIEEEDGGIGGVLATILRGYTADAAIIPEPNFISDESIGIASAGVMYFRIKILGRAAHAAHAHRGVNAIIKALKIIDALESLNRERQKRVRYPPAEMETDMKGRATTINIGKIHGGDWPSTVAGFVEIEGRVGWPPVESMEHVKREIEDAVREASQKDSWLALNTPKIEWFGWRVEASEQDRNHPFVSLVAENVERVTGCTPIFTGGYAGLDTRFFINYVNMPAITYGPKGYNLHSSDEYVDLNSVVNTAKIVGLTIMDWCGY